MIATGFCENDIVALRKCLVLGCAAGDLQFAETGLRPWDRVILSSSP